MGLSFLICIMEVMIFILQSSSISDAEKQVSRCFLNSSLWLTIQAHHAPVPQRQILWTPPPPPRPCYSMGNWQPLPPCSVPSRAPPPKPIKQPAAPHISLLSGTSPGELLENQLLNEAICPFWAQCSPPVSGYNQAVCLPNHLLQRKDGPSGSLGSHGYTASHSPIQTGQIPGMPGCWPRPPKVQKSPASAQGALPVKDPLDQGTVT